MPPNGPKRNAPKGPNRPEHPTVNLEEGRRKIREGSRGRDRVPSPANNLVEAIQGLVHALPLNELETKLGALERSVARLESQTHRAASRVSSTTDVLTGDPLQAGLPEPNADEVRNRGPHPVQPYSIGDSIDDRFQVREVLGRGGFSTVYRVFDELEDGEFALKLFHSAPGYRAVVRELNALRSVDHPNVVKVIWADKTIEGEWFLITEYVRGTSLEHFVGGSASLPIDAAVDVCLDILSALIGFHPSARLVALDSKRKVDSLSESEFEEWDRLRRRALVHRDIKPLNVLVTQGGAKLLDFNIASRVGDAVHTQSGTPPYQSPDADLTRWDVSTDLFAVGVILYQLLCDGHHPYVESRPMVDEEIIDPGTLRDDLSPDLRAFLYKACASDRARRFLTADEMQLALRSIRARLASGST
jgi:serine/threonine protein kinase